MPEDNKEAAELDFSCSVFENAYDSSHTIGSVPIKNIFEKDINSLKNLCMCNTDERNHRIRHRHIDSCIFDRHRVF